MPHGSGNTKIISDLCVGFAKELGLRYRQEACNNLIIWKDGSVGYEQSEPIILQGHIDMVCAKTDECAKDMAAEGLDLRTDGEETTIKLHLTPTDTTKEVYEKLNALIDEVKNTPLDSTFDHVAALLASMPRVRVASGENVVLPVPFIRSLPRT